ncbi:MAG: hypothetical protein V9E94_09120 [Microthrixaceae bacterium]
MSDLHCQGCGSTDCEGCLPELDPPRYCAHCGAWVATQVTTKGWVSSCRRCDTRRSSA